MDNNSPKENNFIDVEFSETNSELKNISKNNHIIYYSCEQVGKIVEEPVSTIRYWTKMFTDILEVEIVNTQRKYKKKDIENLLFIKKLIRVDNMSIKQVQEYFNNTDDLKIINYNNPVELKVFTRELSEYFDDKINSINENLTIKQEKLINNLFDNINNIIDKKMSNILENNNKILEKNEKIKENIEIILKNQEKIKEENDEIHRLQQKLIDKKLEYEKNRGWFNRFMDRFK